MSCESVNNTSTIKIRENCRYEIVTYGDAINCVIKLDERQ